MEEVAWVDYRVHLSVHADYWTCHLRSHLSALMASLRHLVLLEAIHIGQIHNRLVPYFVVTVSKRASILIRTLLTLFIEFANIAFVVSWINTHLFLIPYLASHLRRLRHRLANLRINRPRETVVLLAHWQTLGTTISSTVLFNIWRSFTEIIVFVEPASEVWLLARLALESASARHTPAHTATLVAWTTSGHTATRGIASVHVVAGGLTKLGLAVGESTFVAHLAVATVFKMAAQLGFIL